MGMEQLLVFALVAIAAGGGFYALAYPSLSGGNRAQKRQRMISGSRAEARIAAAASRESASRRTQVAESLKQLEEREKQRRTPPLSVRLEQAGLDWSKRQFTVRSALLGVVLGVLVMVLVGTPLVALGAAFVGALGLPRWALNYLRKRRQNVFINEFPNAIDIIVRGVKAGLPLGDCIRMVAAEAQEPVKSEFRRLVEMQGIGIPMADAVERFYERLGLSEANFFAIVITIQQKSGGNLSEALGNLSRVLRERRKMQNKIQAMSMEAKASASIIGALPIMVGLGLYFLSPEYISMLWKTNLGLVMLGGCAIWMGAGIMVMRKMIQFDF